VRVAISGFPKMTPEEAVNTFIDLYMAPQDNASEIENRRNQIRDNTSINHLLFINRAGLHYIFDKLKMSKMTGVSIEKC